MPFKDLFSASASEYARNRPGYPPELADYLADLSPSREGAWDAGCGSGQLSIPLAARFDRIIGTDASAAQLGMARPHPRTAYVCARAEAAPIAPGAMDLAAAAQAAHWFDLAAYYDEVRRVVRAGGVIALIAYATFFVADDVDPIVRAFYRTDLASYWLPERRHVESGYATLPFPFEELPAPRMEARASWSLEDVLAYIGTWSAVQALRRSDGDAALRRLAGELAEVWGPGGARRLVRWPLSLRVGRV